MLNKFSLSTPQEIYIYPGVRVYKLQGREYMAGVHVNYIPSEKDVFLSCHKCKTEKKFRVPMRNQPSALWIPCSSALPLSHRDSTLSEVYYKAHMTGILHTVRFSYVDSVMFVNRIRDMVSFELGKGN